MSSQITLNVTLHKALTPKITESLRLLKVVLDCFVHRCAIICYSVYLMLHPLDARGDHDVLEHSSLQGPHPGVTHSSDDGAEIEHCKYQELMSV